MANHRCHRLVATVVMVVVSVSAVGCARRAEPKVVPLPPARPAVTEAAEPVPRLEEVAMEITSSAYQNGGVIPRKYATKAAGGGNVSPGFEWSDAPTATVSFALVMVDQASVANYWVHWAVIGIPPTATSIPEDASRTKAMPKGARELASSFGTIGYGGPQPPAGTGSHTYVTSVYALDVPTLELGQRVTLADFAKAADGHVLASASYEGTFSP